MNSMSNVHHDTFVTAMEGGINYWADVTAYSWDCPNWSARILDLEGDAHTINVTTIKRGFEALAKAEPNSQFAKDAAAAACFIVTEGRASDPWEDRLDADSADHLIQMALFGEIVYG